MKQRLSLVSNFFNKRNISWYSRHMSVWTLKHNLTASQPALQIPRTRTSNYTKLWEFMRLLCSQIILVLMIFFTVSMFLKLYCLNRFTLIDIPWDKIMHRFRELQIVKWDRQWNHSWRGDGQMNGSALRKEVIENLTSLPCSSRIRERT